MVLEWVPSVGALATVPPRVAALSDAQAERLRKALTLLDIDQSGDLSRAELIDTLHTAEDYQHGDATARAEALLEEHGGLTPPEVRPTPRSNAPLAAAASSTSP